VGLAQPKGDWTMTPCLSIALLVACQGLGRQVPDWSYKKLFERSDLVVVAKAVSTSEAGKKIKEKAPHRDLQAVLTTFKVVHVIKGKFSEKKLVVVHYRVHPKKELLVANGPHLVEFHAKCLEISYPGGKTSLPPPDYMLFLKKRKDGRYECVTGQVDPIYSVKQLVQPLPEN
jgi:hypothetical protein